MKLLILTPGLSPDAGRAERYALEVATRLHGRMRIRVVTTESEHPEPDHPFDVVRVGTGLAGFVARAATAVRRSVTADHFETALATSWHGALAALIGRPGDGGMRVHVVVHGPELHASPVPAAGAATFNRLRAYALGRVDMFHPVSRTVGRELVSLGVPDSRVHTVPVGIDPRLFAPADGFPARRRLGIGSRPMVLTVAGPGATSVVASMPDVLTEHPGAVLVVRGEGHDAEELVQQADRLGIRDAVRFAGRVEGSELCMLYSAANVFALAPPARKAAVDTDGTTMLEAAACGVPLVGSRVGDIPDSVEDGVTGLLVQPGKPEAVAAAIVFFLNDRGAAEEFGLAARHHVLARANWDRVTDRLLGSMETA